MLNQILEREDIKDFIKLLTTESLYINKNVPNKISEEKITKIEYSLYTFVDAIIKYFIIIGDIELFDNYLDQLKRIIKKVENHNDIQIGIIKLLIKYVAHKINIENLDDIESKKKLVEYFYNSYIVEGYFYHGFPYVYKNNVLTNGLDPNNYYESLNEIKEIDKILNKYKLENIFSKGLDKIPYISVTDSLFMAYFYATSSPLYLKELCIDISNNSKKNNECAYILKDYNECKENINLFIKRKEVKESDKIKIFTFLENEWTKLDISNANPIIAIIKRKELGKNYLSNYQNILNNLENTDITTSIKKILETRYNEEEIINRIPSDKITILELPNIKELYKKKENVKKEDKQEEKLESSNLEPVINETGSATIVALLGVFLITLGVTITIIMLGK